MSSSHVARIEVERDCLFPLVTGTRVAGTDLGGGLITGQGSAPWPWWRTYNRGQGGFTLALVEGKSRVRVADPGPGGGLITGPGWLHAGPG